jgi:tRNA wybutosine-synthesizing protein 2
MRPTPFMMIKKTVSSVLPSDLVDFLPRKWEKIGSVVVMKVPEELGAYKQVLGKVYAECLGCRTALNDTGGISGVYREPVVEVIYGSSQTETIHTEHGIRFKMDPQRIMFSSGNMKERLRIARIAHVDETVVDLFAGIGYFSLPMAVYSTPKKIFACEMNPVAYAYLCQNVVLNHVGHVVEPCFGDNRMVAPFAGGV